MFKILGEFVKSKSLTFFKLFQTRYLNFNYLNPNLNVQIMSSKHTIRVLRSMKIMCNVKLVRSIKQVGRIDEAYK